MEKWALSVHDDFLAANDIIDFRHPRIASLAATLRAATPAATAKRCFNWVRDEIEHCLDFQREEVTCIASDVLTVGTGFCYGKSHLLVALLRANGIAAGLCYQRLAFAGANPPFCLHGLVAVWLDGIGWTRCDPRGNDRSQVGKPDLDGQFVAGKDCVVFRNDFPGEYLYPEIYPEPWPELVEALARLKQASQFRWQPIDVSLPVLTI